MEYVDIIPKILRYLKPIDIYNFNKTCKFCHQYINIKESIIDEINYRLHLIFGDRLIDFKENMQKSRCVISGSFILQCILNEYWEKSDIDIYAPVKDHNDLNIDNFLDQVLFVEGDSHVTEYHDCIYWVRDYERKFAPYRIQILGVLEIEADIHNLNEWFTDDKLYLPSPELLKRSIDDMCDFSICKNMYYYDGKDNLILSNLEEIFTKITNFKNGYSLKYSIKRYYKYKKKGFKFTNKKLLTYNQLRYDDQIFITLGGYNINPIDEVIKSFGNDIFNDHDYGYRIDNEKGSECDPETCVVRFLNKNLRHYHLHTTHPEHLSIYQDSIAIL